MTERVTIIGFGSLLSEESAKRTCPSLRNFRLGKVQGYSRVFNKVDPKSECLDSAHIASWALMAKQNSATLITLFEIDKEDYPAFARREVDYDLRCVQYSELETGQKGQGIACCGFENDAEFHAYLAFHPIQKERHEVRRAELYKGRVWRKDILPRPKYLALCLEAARALGKNYVENILNHTYLADRRTTLASYLSENADELDYIRDIKWIDNFIKVKIKADA